MAVRRYNPDTLHAPAGQYSHLAVVPGGMSLVFIAGQVGARLDGSLAGDIEAQIRQTFENLLKALAAEGLDANALVQLTYYLTDKAHVPILREVRQTYLPDPPPATTALIVASLMDDTWLFELDAVAAKSGESG
ncbi:MAG: RidA family protein [Pseudomonadota bacterium]